jgi:hypothetical protein
VFDSTSPGIRFFALRRNFLICGKLDHCLRFIPCGMAFRNVFCAHSLYDGRTCPITENMAIIISTKLS